MRKLIIALSAALVVSNGWWLYRSIDQGVTNAYREQERKDLAGRVETLTALANEAVKNKPKAEVQLLAKRVAPRDEVFEKDGALHIGWIALLLAEDGRVVGIARDQ